MTMGGSPESRCTIASTEKYVEPPLSVTRKRNRVPTDVAEQQLHDDRGRHQLDELAKAVSAEIENYVYPYVAGLVGKPLRPEKIAGNLKRCGTRLSRPTGLTWCAATPSSSSNASEPLSQSSRRQCRNAPCLDAASGNFPRQARRERPRELPVSMATRRLLHVSVISRHVVRRDRSSAWKRCLARHHSTSRRGGSGRSSLVLDGRSSLDLGGRFSSGEPTMRGLLALFAASV